MNPVSARERRRVLAFAGLVMLLTSLPYLLGILNQDAEWRYTGTLFAGDDTNSYIALVRRGALGEWLFRTPYSVFPQNGALIYFPYLLAGKPAAP